MSAAERAVWEDAEGSFDFYGDRSVYSIRTSQAERGILEDYCFGARSDGVECSLYAQRRHKTEHFKYDGIIYYTQISGIRNVVKELILTNPWRRNADKIRRIEELRKLLASPAKQEERKMREAATELAKLRFEFAPQNELKVPVESTVLTSPTSAATSVPGQTFG